MHCSVDDESLVNLPYVIKLHQESAKIYYSPQPDQSTETHTSKNKEPIDNYCQSCKRLSALSASLADEAQQNYRQMLNKLQVRIKDLEENISVLMRYIAEGKQKQDLRQQMNSDQEQLLMSKNMSESPKSNAFGQNKSHQQQGKEQRQQKNKKLEIGSQRIEVEEKHSTELNQLREQIEQLRTHLQNVHHYQIHAFPDLQIKIPTAPKYHQQVRTSPNSNQHLANENKKLRQNIERYRIRLIETADELKQIKVGLQNSNCDIFSTPRVHKGKQSGKMLLYSDQSTAKAAPTVQRTDKTTKFTVAK